MNLPKIKTIKTKEWLKDLALTLGEKSFLTFLGLLVIALIFGAIIYYRYNILAKREEVQIIKAPLYFQEKSYQNISKIWQEREKKFEEVGLKEYFNPFEVNRLEETMSEESPGSPEIDQE